MRCLDLLCIILGLSLNRAFLIWQGVTRAVTPSVGGLWSSGLSSLFLMGLKKVKLLRQPLESLGVVGHRRTQLDLGHHRPD